MPENVRFGLPPEIVEAIAARCRPAVRLSSQSRSESDKIDGHEHFPDSASQDRNSGSAAASLRQDRRPDQPCRRGHRRRPQLSLFSQQHEDGYWCGELEADTTLESDYILLHTLLGHRQSRSASRSARIHPATTRTKTAAGSILRRRPFEHQRLGQGLLRPEAGGIFTRTIPPSPAPARRFWNWAA